MIGLAVTNMKRIKAFTSDKCTFTDVYSNEKERFDKTKAWA